MLSIGLMSGTSMDGIDAALIKTDGVAQVTELDDCSLVYDLEMRILLKAAETAVREQAGNLTLAQQHYSQALEAYLRHALTIADAAIPEKIKALSLYFHGNENLPITFDQIVKRSTELHIDVVKQLLQKTHYAPKDIQVIGYHGQTLLHRPAEKITIQIGDGELLAKKTGITVVNDFRSNDVAAGGQGAPFAPLYHQALAVRDNIIPSVIVNCGGIANVTVIKGRHLTELMGFDTGPGNGLLDRYIKQKTQGKIQMDVDGQYGLQGKVHPNILALLTEHSIQFTTDNFFTRQPPKSLDIGELKLIPELDTLCLEDACRTLEAFTADTIVASTDFFQSSIPRTWILAGGGWNNRVIHKEFVARLKAKLGDDVEIKTADEIGWNGKALEAQIFAYLAVRCLQGLPISTPGTTRVPKPLTGGQTHFFTQE